MPPAVPPAPGTVAPAAPAREDVTWDYLVKNTPPQDLQRLFATMGQQGRGGMPMNPVEASKLISSNPWGSVNPNSMNNPNFLLNAQYNPNTEFHHSQARANQAGNAAANAVFDYNPATGRMDLKKTPYALDPMSAQYDKNQWQENQNLGFMGMAHMAGGGHTGRNLFNREGYQGALDAGGTATAGVQRAANNQVGMDATSQAAQRGQLDQYGQDIGMLRASAQGQGPSAAQSLARSQLDNNIRAQSSMAASARGGNVAAAQRAASLAGSNMMMQSANQMSALRAQEQLTAQAQLAAAQGQHAQAQAMARGQDLQRGFQAVQGAGMAAQAAQAQTGAQAGFTGAQQAQYGLGLQQTQMGIGAYQGHLGNQLGMQGLQAQVAAAQTQAAQGNQNMALQYYGIAQGAGMDQQRLLSDQQRWDAAQRQQAQAAKDAQNAAMLGMGLGLAGPLLGAAFGPGGAVAGGVAQGAVTQGASGYTHNPNAPLGNQFSTYNSGYDPLNSSMGGYYGGGR